MCGIFAYCSFLQEKVSLVLHSDMVKNGRKAAKSIRAMRAKTGVALTGAVRKLGMEVGRTVVSDFQSRQFSFYAIQKKMENAL